MTLQRNLEDVVPIVLSSLTPQERAEGVAYVFEEPLISGSRLELPGIVIEVPAECHLAFIDREPTANWGHSARYVLVVSESREAQSFEARLPPFQTGTERHWRMVYKAQSVPDAAVAFPQQPEPRNG